MCNEYFCRTKLLKKIVNDHCSLCFLDKKENILFARNIECCSKVI